MNELVKSYRAGDFLTTQEKSLVKTVLFIYENQKNVVANSISEFKNPNSADIVRYNFAANIHSFHTNSKSCVVDNFYAVNISGINFETTNNLLDIGILIESEKKFVVIVNELQPRFKTPSEEDLEDKICDMFKYVGHMYSDKAKTRELLAYYDYTHLLACYALYISSYEEDDKNEFKKYKAIINKLKRYTSIDLYVIDYKKINKFLGINDRSSLVQKTSKKISSISNNYFYLEFGVNNALSLCYKKYKWLLATPQYDSRPDKLIEEMKNIQQENENDNYRSKHILKGIKQKVGTDNMSDLRNKLNIPDLLKKKFLTTNKSNFIYTPFIPSSEFKDSEVEKIINDMNKKLS